MLDLTVAAFCLAAFYCVVLLGRYWFSHPVPSAEISQSARALPLYAFYSVVRIGVAYLLSLVFAVGYGYYAAYHPRVEAFMIAVLDILQSIPVLSFLPGVMLAMVSLLPTRQLGVEMGAILLIFTGQVWNMAFSFYSSIRSIPRELREASQIYGFTAWQRFWQLELPFSAIGLVWNSMVSVAGGWFFLMACEMFVLGDRDFRLPGLGSYLQTAAGNGNTRAMIWGLAVMIAIIVATDQLIWRPVIAWADKFKFEQVESSQRASSPILYALRNSNAIGWLHERTVVPLGERIYHGLAARRLARSRPAGAQRRVASALAHHQQLHLHRACWSLAIFAAFHAVLLLRQLHGAEILELLKGAGATFLRVNASLLIAALWTIPVGVAIGFHPRLARIAQPLAQIAASVPATALFPVLLIALVRAGGGLGIGSIALMLLGTQWYILFNVIAGAMAIPSDLQGGRRPLPLRQPAALDDADPPRHLSLSHHRTGHRLGRRVERQHHRRIFPPARPDALHARPRRQISRATDHGQFDMLLMATIIMALMVVTINRLVWRPLFHLAETKYRLEG